MLFKLENLRNRITPTNNTRPNEKKQKKTAKIRNGKKLNKKLTLTQVVVAVHYDDFECLRFCISLFLLCSSPSLKWTTKTQRAVNAMLLTDTSCSSIEQICGYIVRITAECSFTTLVRKLSVFWLIQWSVHTFGECMKFNNNNNNNNCWTLDSFSFRYWLRRYTFRLWHFVFIHDLCLFSFVLWFRTSTWTAINEQHKNDYCVDDWQIDKQRKCPPDSDSNRKSGENKAIEIFIRDEKRPEIEHESCVENGK